jgi:hypothetical protein
MTGKLSPEGEVIAAYGAAMVAAFQVLINCLEENDAVLPGQFPDALGVYMETVTAQQSTGYKSRHRSETYRARRSCSPSTSNTRRRKQEFATCLIRLIPCWRGA